MNDNGPDSAQTRTDLRVLLADDNAAVRRRHARLLDHHAGIVVAATAEDGAQALHILDRRRIDIALLEVEMPHMTGIESARLISDRHPGVVVVMLTDLVSHTRLEEAIGAGARGFLTKDMDVDHIVTCLRNAAHGRTVLGPAPMQIVADRFRRYAEARADNIDFISAVSTLPERLKNVYRSVVQGLSNREVATATGMSEHTVRTYVTEILSLLGCPSRTQLTLKATALEATDPHGMRLDGMQLAGGRLEGARRR